MKFFKFDGQGNLMEISEVLPAVFRLGDRWHWESNADRRTEDEAKKIAELATALTGNVWISGNSSTGNFQIIEAPKIGDDVSEGFNGDYDYVGTITAITPTWRITTSTGVKFSRVKNSLGWKRVHSNTSMIHGIINARNPHF